MNVTSEKVGVSGRKTLQVIRTVRPESARHVGEGIDSEAVEAASFHPPIGSLQEVSGYQRVLLGKVRENIGEPAFKRAAVVLLDRVGIGHRRIVIVGIDVVLRGAVRQPGAGCHDAQG